MIDLKFSKIDLNLFVETLIFGIKNFVLIKPMHNKLVDQNITNCHNVKSLSKKNFWIDSFRIVQEIA